MMTVKEVMTRRHPVPVYRQLLVLIAMTVLFIGGIYGAKVYSDDKSRDAAAYQTLAARDIEIARYEVDRAAYDAALYDHTDCEHRVERSQSLRRVLLGLSDRLGADAMELARIAGYIDEEFEELTVEDDCPPVPAAPTPPPAVMTSENP